jgi:hypothetical protein
VVLCENSQISLLCDLPFIGLVEEVRKVLEEKARFGDIAKSPNFYSILYAFHIKRGNYRQGL